MGVKLPQRHRCEKPLHVVKSHAQNQGATFTDVTVTRKNVKLPLLFHMKSQVSSQLCRIHSSR